MINVLFNSIETKIIDELGKAKSSVQIAVAWFNNKKLHRELISRANDGVAIEIIVVNDVINNGPKGLDFQRLIDCNIKFNFCVGRRLMHNKFCIIDENVIINGSYNWTHAAEHSNLENVILTNDQPTLQAFKIEFQRLKNLSDEVVDIQSYLLEHPPHDNYFDTNELFLNETLLEMDVLPESIPLQQQFENIQQAVNLFPKNEDLKKHQAKIYSEFSKDLEQFCVRYPQVFLFQIGKKYKWNYSTLRIYQDKCSPGHIQSNLATVWTFDLIQSFKSILFVNSANNGSLCSFIYNYEIFISLHQLSTLDHRLQRHYEKKKNYSCFDDTTIDPNTPFYINRIAEHYPRPLEVISTIDEQTDFKLLQENADFNWTTELLETYLEKIDWWFGSYNWPYIPWTEPSLLRIEALKNWQFSIFCKRIPLTEQQVEQFKDILDWSGVVENKVCGSYTFFQKFKPYILPHLGLLSKNRAFSWTFEFISEYQGALNFRHLSANPSLPWSVILLRAFKDRWHYHGSHSISANDSIVWTEEILNEFKEKLDWVEMAKTSNLPWSIPLIEKYAALSDSSQYFVGIAYNHKIWETLFQPILTDEFLISVAERIDASRSIHSY